MLTKGRTTFFSLEKIRFFFTLELLMDKSAQRSGQTGMLVKLKTVNSNLALFTWQFLPAMFDFGQNCKTPTILLFLLLSFYRIIVYSLTKLLRAL